MNTLSATITDITASEHLSLIKVSIGDDTLHLLLAEASHLPHGAKITLAFKETEIILMKNSIPTSANSASAVVQTIKQGLILTEITMMYHGNLLTALVPTPLVNTLLLHEGDMVVWVIQPSEISLLRETHGI